MLISLLSAPEIYTIEYKSGKKQVIRVQKLVGLPPPALELLGVFLRFRITFAEVITFSGASAHEF